jgi:multidrug transporter EmrE-like cation transporter
MSTTPPDPSVTLFKNVLAILIVILFLGMIIASFFMLSKANDQTAPVLSDAIKTGVATFGTALTTAIGFYFGSRETATYRNMAENLAEQNKDLSAKLAARSAS